MILVAAAIIMLAASALPQEGFKDFQSFYRFTTEINRDRFKDLDLISIGDTVLVPTRDGEDILNLVVKKPQEGVHDCIWRLSHAVWYAEEWLEENYQIIPAEPEPENIVVAEAILPIQKAGWDWKNLWWLLFAFPFIWLAVREWRRHHPDRLPPQLGNMEFSRPEDISQRIKAIDPKKYEGCSLKVTRGKVIRNFGPWRILVKMGFGDGSFRPTYIKPGETVVKVVVSKPGQEDRIEYWRAHCGNSMNAITKDRFELPEGWHFIPYASDQLEEVEQIKRMAEEVKKKIEEQPAQFAKQQKEMVREIMKNLPPANQNLELERENIRIEFLPIVYFGGTNSPLTISSIHATRVYKEKQKTEPEA